MSYRKQKKIYKRNLKHASKLSGIGRSWLDDLFVEITKVELAMLRLRKKGIM